jgi:hypothetical protein
MATTREWDDVVAEAMEAKGITAVPCKRCDNCGVLFDTVRPCDCETPDISEVSEKAFEAMVLDAELDRAEAAKDAYWDARIHAHIEGD